MAIDIVLPRWVSKFVTDSPGLFSGDLERMSFVVELARRNVQEGTGGPFGAAVFDRAGRLIAAGINVVEAYKCSILHAEIVAIILAQKRLRRYDIGNGGREYYELFASAEPCAMCFGAIPWSGVSRVVCGARDEDIRSIGFDEGPKVPDWTVALSQRNIDTTQDVLRGQAIGVLQAYAKSGGTIYNGGMKGANANEKAPTAAHKTKV